MIVLGYQIVGDILFFSCHFLWKFHKSLFIDGHLLLLTGPPFVSAVFGYQAQ